MGYLSVIKFSFNILNRHVVTINSNNRLTTFRLLFMLVYFLYLCRRILMISCMHFRIHAYFEIDVSKKEYYTSIDYYPVNFTRLILGVFSSIFDVRLFTLFYLKADKQVWSHLYDLVVCNKKQFSLQLWRSPQNDSLIKQNRSKLIRMMVQFCPSLQLSTSSPQLLHYPFLKQPVRLWCLQVYYAAELVTTFTVAHYAFHYYLSSENLEHYSVVQKLAYLIFYWISDCLYDCIFYIMYFLVEITLYLVCHVYTDQYRRVNSELEKIKNRLGRSKNHVNSFQLSTAAKTYRISHTRLTAFILHYNDSTVSKLIAYFIHYLMPFHAFVSVCMYVRMHKLQKTSTVIHSIIVHCLYLLLLLVITLFTAKVNSKIANSGSTVGTILARKGVLVAQQRSSNWISSLDAVWRREVFKLSFYYEMVWREQKELAFTAGLMNKTMNWSYLSEVSAFFKKKFCFYFIFSTQLAFLYTVFVLFFLSKFITGKDGFKI